jgi:hypothetical protein
VPQEQQRPLVSQPNLLGRGAPSARRARERDEEAGPAVESAPLVILSSSLWRVEREEARVWCGGGHLSDTVRATSR